MDNKEIRLLLRGLSFDFMEIPPCTFIMGSSPDECWHRDDELQHSVTLTKKFWIAKNPVSVEQYNCIAGTAYKDDKKPFFQQNPRQIRCTVNWYDAQKFCNILNDRYADFLPSGYMFALPTEAQWECACKANVSIIEIEKVIIELYEMQNKYNEGFIEITSNDPRRYYSSNLPDEYIIMMKCLKNAMFSNKRLDIEHITFEANQKISKMYHIIYENVCLLDSPQWCRDWYEFGYSSDPEFLTRNHGNKKTIRGCGKIYITYSKDFATFGSPNFPNLDDCFSVARRDIGDPQNDVAAFRIAIVPMLELKQ